MIPPNSAAAYRSLADTTVSVRQFDPVSGPGQLEWLALPPDADTRISPPDTAGEKNMEPFRPEEPSRRVAGAWGAEVEE